MNYLLDKALDLLFWIAEAVINLLPTYSPSEPGSIQSVLDVLATFNNYIPIVEMAYCIIAYLSFCTVWLGARMIMKLGRLG